MIIVNKIIIEYITIAMFIFSLVPFILLPLKIKLGLLRYTLLYIFLPVYYLLIYFYVITNNDLYLSYAYVFETIFFFNIYRSYLSNELFLVILPITFLIDDFALMISFYFVTFNLVEFTKKKINDKYGSNLILISTIFYWISILISIFLVFEDITYFSFYSYLFFTLGTIFFIIPALETVKKYEKK
ncbi:MAG: hypothetical protein ACP5JT_03150 [Thermoplasmata archaeon]|jgi:hypothetical protein